MLTISNSLQSISCSGNIRMGLSFAKESHALFLKKYSPQCSIRIKEVCEIEKGKSITEDNTRPGVIPVVAGGKSFAYYHDTFNRGGNVITVSASGASSGYVNYWDQPIWASDCITVVSKNEDIFITKFIFHLLKIVQSDIYLLQKGADQPHVYSDDIGAILIPEVSIDKQRKILSDIASIENKIDELQAECLDAQGIIDSVFSREFSFDYSEFETKKVKKTFAAKVGWFSNNPDLRFSAKYHREAKDYVLCQLTDLTEKKIKHFLAEPIVLGASISPEDYSDDGEYCYVSMATIKGWYFDPAAANNVSKAYSDLKADKTVRKNDIIIARSGEGTIGKAALITEEGIKGIFADFTMRVRLKNYVPEFAYYYFHTNYFQYLIEVYKKGLGNNTNIFPNVIQEFPMIDIPMIEQQRIVDEIHSEIAKQDDVKARIAELRAQIDSIIEDAIAEGD